MDRYTPFSGDMPTLEDLNFLMDAYENGILHRFREMFRDGIIQGLTIYEDAGSYYVEAGVAYVDGERIVVPEATESADLTVPTSGSRYIFIGHTTTTSRPKTHEVTAVVTDVWRSDSFSLRVSESATTQAGELRLGRLDSVGDLHDERTFLTFAHDIASRGTTASEFFVGKGSAKPRRLLAEPLTPVKPLNVRLAEVRPERVSGIEVNPSYRDTYLSPAAIGGSVQQSAVAVFKWGWDDVVGTGGSDSVFTATNLANISEDLLVGHHLYIPSISSDFIITANSASSSGTVLITVSDLGSQSVDLSGIVVVSGNPATIHANASEYYVATHQHTDDGNDRELPGRTRTGAIALGASPVPQFFEVLLPLGSRYRAHVIARNSTARSEAASSPISRIEFTAALTPGFPSDWSDGSITAVATEYGMEVQINASQAVLDALSGFAYGYVLTSVASEVNLTNPAHNPSTTSGVQTTIRVPIETRGTYAVAVRPLMSGQYVGDAKRTRVTAGGGGHLPNDKAFPGIEVDIRPGNQSLQYDNTTGLFMVRAENGSPVGASNPSRMRRGQQFVVNYGGVDHVYVVTDQSPVMDGSQLSAALEMEEITSHGTDKSTLFANETAVEFSGGDSISPATRIARHIWSLALSSEIIVTGLALNCSYTDGTPTDPGIIRVYQKGNSGLATALEVNRYGGSPLFNEANLEILRANGELALEVDAFDPNVPSRNKKRIMGKLTIYYRDKAQQDASRTRSNNLQMQ